MHAKGLECRFLLPEHNCTEEFYDINDYVKHISEVHNMDVMGVEMMKSSFSKEKSKLSKKYRSLELTTVKDILKKQLLILMDVHKDQKEVNAGINSRKKRFKKAMLKWN